MLSVLTWSKVTPVAVNLVTLEMDRHVQISPVSYIRYDGNTVLTQNYAPLFCWLGLATSMGGPIIE